MVTGSSQADAITVAGEQHRSELMFQLFDPPRNAVTGHTQPARRRAKTAGPRHLKENPNAFPVGTRTIA